MGAQMGSLREIVLAAEAAKAAGTSNGTAVERARLVFHDDDRRSNPVEHDKRQKTSKNAPCSSVPTPREWNNGTAHCALTRDLASLPKMPCPRGLDAAIWRSVILDVLALEEQGWVRSALCLGWSALDLFGAVPDKHGDPDADGLAVKLDCRRVLAICADFATVSDGEGARSFIYRGNNNGAALLWDIGGNRCGE